MGWVIGARALEVRLGVRSGREGCGSLEGGDLFLEGVFDRSLDRDWEDDGVCWNGRGHEILKWECSSVISERNQYNFIS